ncbi:MAG: STAS/SEC14 domain-containing protein [Anaerolineae bacterium]|nr:STAS/SEC14 domain-containing protein [Anaerolineae bacterium]
MIEILGESTPGCIGFKVSGKLTAEDYDLLLPRLDEAIEAQGRINLLVVMGGFDGWAGLEAAKADFELGTHQYRQVDRAAFVGEKRWQKWAINMMDPFTRRTVERFFDPEHLDEAWEWVKGG